MGRGALLIVAVLACMAQAGDTLRIRAAICKDQRCNERTQVAFAPARVSVQVYITQHPGNRSLVYGLVCDDLLVAQSLADLDGHGDPPFFTVEYRGVGAGTCHAHAALAFADRSVQRARSGAVLIQARD